MKKILVILLGVLLWGKTISTSERTDDWWLDPHVEVTVKYRPFFIPKGMITMDECSKRDFYVAPWVTELEAEISAYNSEAGQTDSTPFTAANNRRVFPGGIATNVFPCGTEFTIPGLFGNRVFTVNDRMNRRYDPLRTDGITVNMDVWMAEKRKAKELGRQRFRVIVKKYAGA